MNFRFFQALILFSSILFLVVGCGRVNPPEQLEPNGYPHSYPKTSDVIIN